MSMLQYPGPEWCASLKFPGNASTIYDMIEKSGIDLILHTEKDYIWTGQCNHRCRKAQVDNYTLTLWGYNYDNYNSEDILIQQLQISPLVVDVHSSCEQLQTYTKGIFKSENCKGAADHTMLLVGYGSDNGENYWILRNSLGNNWGEEGYIRVLRGKNIIGIGYGITQPYST